MAFKIPQAVVDKTLQDGLAAALNETVTNYSRKDSLGISTVSFKTSFQFSPAIGTNNPQFTATFNLPFKGRLTLKKMNSVAYIEPAAGGDLTIDHTFLINVQKVPVLNFFVGNWNGPPTTTADQSQIALPFSVSGRSPSPMDTLPYNFSSSFIVTLNTTYNFLAGDALFYTLEMIFENIE